MEQTEINKFSIIYNAEKTENKSQILNIFIPFNKNEFYSFCGLFNGDNIKCFISPDDEMQIFFFQNEKGFLQIPFDLEQINYIISYLIEEKDKFYKDFYQKFCGARKKLEQAK